MFKVHINSLKERQKPELDEDYVSDKGFDSVDEYKDDIKKKLTEKKENEAKAKNEDEIIEAIIEDSKMDIPEAMEDTEAENLVNAFARNIASQGMSFEMYMQYTGMTEDRLKNQMKEQAGKNIRSRLVLEAIGEAEKIEATDEEFEEEVKKMAEQYRMEPDKLKDLMGDEEKKNVRHDIVMQMVCDFIVKEAKPVAESKKKKTTKKDGE